jgi:hypothetical protein
MSHEEVNDYCMFKAIIQNRKSIACKKIESVQFQIASMNCQEDAREREIPFNSYFTTKWLDRLTCSFPFKHWMATTKFWIF